MNTIPNRQAVCDTLIELAKSDRDLLVLCSDSRGSASLGPFAAAYPEQFIETGIAEQSLVSTAAGLARCGKKPWAASPACFLSTRSMEQIKVDVAYSGANVKLLGISGGVSYGALGMTHHSAQDIAAIASIPGMRVYLPSDRFQTAKLVRALCGDDKPAYIRLGRNAVEDIYAEDNCPFELDRANLLREGGDVLLIACGETVVPSLRAAEFLRESGVSAAVLDLYCVKPLDGESVLSAAKAAKAVITVEEHSMIGGMGGMVCQLLAAKHPMPVRCLALPDEPAITGTSKEVFRHYGLDAEGIAAAARELLSGSN